VSVVRELYQLQLIDSEREEKSRRLSEVEASLGKTGDVVRAQEDVIQTQDNLDQLRIQMRDLELEIASLNAKLKKNQERLYSGRVRNPKELSNLQEEAAALRRRRSELEDDQLELMIAIEEDEAELAERQARLNQIEASWREEQATLSAEEERLELRLAELEEQRQGKRARIGPGDVALYDDLHNRLGGTGVALLKRGICQVCGVDVPTGVAQAVERGEDLHYCTTCNRLLYGGR
jgi:predicted  nucleic acid-binding Zn-ribbon protein